ncbi:carboxypeptidase-like regulatory domain-containing protein [Lutibacter sp. A64]|uniref:TonB-dependent receptor n=1 Tax=Lutibacter sp. A64 TaxID=2918526 RepID=UPI001F058ED8|nr:carboxypeptidase-like regulatory domain-containing protein [Lutibacter sp. A64]UMB52834.1 carboxypeptidase-like regulatory domain-containing protein [Lutibacter sp. A64]
MKKVLLFLLFTQFVTAQEIIIKGVVTDSIAPLAYASIIAKPLINSINMSFAISDEKGKFKLTLIKNIDYVITASYLGYKSQSIELNSNDTKVLSFILSETEQKLNEIVIVQEVPIEVKEDTITYNVKKFITGKERKLKNILKKLPGIEIDKNGGVIVNGKKVSKVLVENKKFFGGSSTKLAIENIPANVINKIEIIDNYNDIAFLKGVVESNELAMNVKLKEDKKKFVFGDVDAGKGSENHYLTHAGLFYYSPKTNINFIGDINNIGKKFFSFRDYLSFENASSKVLRDESSIYNTSSSNFSTFLNNQKAFKNDNKFSAFNFVKSISKKIDFLGYAIFSNSKIQDKIDNFNKYFYDKNVFNESIIKNKHLNNSLGILKFSVDYRVNNLEQIYINSQYKYSKNKSDAILLSIVNSKTQNVETKIREDINSMNHDIEWHKKINKNNTFSFGFNYDYNKSTPKTQWITNKSIFQQLIPLFEADIYNIFQDKISVNNKYTSVIKHYLLLSKRSQLTTTIGNKYLNEKFKVDEYQEIDGIINSFNLAGFGNDIYFSLNDFYTGLQFKYKKGGILAKIEVYSHFYDLRLNQEIKQKENKVVLSPNLLLKYSFNKSEHLNLRYQKHSIFLNSSKYANNFSLLSYNTVFKGNPDLLHNSIYHTARLWYTKFSLYNNIIMNGSISYNKKVNNIKNEIQSSSIESYLMPIIINTPEESWNTSIDIYKIIKKIKIRSKGYINVSNYQQKINDAFVKNENISKRLDISVSTIFDNYPNIEIGIKKSINNFSISKQKNSFHTNNLYFDFGYNFLKGFVFKTDYSKNIYKSKNKEFENTSEEANISLFYNKEDSPLGFEIKISNLFNAKYQSNTFFSDFLISESRAYLLPKIYMFTLSYKI